MTAKADEIPISVQAGEYELIYGTTVHLENRTELTLKVSNLQISFRFENDGGESRFQGSADGKNLILTLYNHNGISEGVMTPFKFATVGGKQLYLTYFVNTLKAESNARKFEFVIYRGTDQ